MAKKGNRVQVILECTEHKESGLPGMSRYITTKNKKNTTPKAQPAPSAPPKPPESDSDSGDYTATVEEKDEELGVRDQQNDRLMVFFMKFQDNMEKKLENLEKRLLDSNN